MAPRPQHQDLRLETDQDGWVRLHFAQAVREPRPHTHDELEWNLVVGGRASYLVDGQRYELARGTSLWLFPEQAHLLVDESADYRMWVAVFSPRMLRRLCTNERTAELTGRRPLGRFSRTLEADELQRLERLLHEVAEQTEDRPHLNAGLAYLALCAWSAHQRAERITPRTDVHPAVERAARLIRDESEPLPLPELAARAGLSQSQLSRLFKAQTGLTLVRYRMLQRLERFRVCYGRGRRRNLTEAALAAGFGSYAHFHRAFKQVHGYPPREYARRLGAGAGAAGPEPSTDPGRAP